MIKEYYAVNMEAVSDLISYLTSLRQKFYLTDNLTLKNVADYTGITAACISTIEKQKVLTPRLETMLTLMNYWQFSDSEIVEVYQALLDKNKKLKLTDKNKKIITKPVEINDLEFAALPHFWTKKRKKFNYTFLDVEKITGLPNSSVNKMENSRINSTFKNLIPLCKLYGITNDEILNFYHRAFKNLDKDSAVNLDYLPKDELINIILKLSQNTTNQDKFYSEKVLVKKKGEKND